MLNLLPLLLILVPSLGAVFPAMMPDRYAGKMWGIGVSVLTFVLAMVMAVFFDWSAPGPQFIWQPPVAYEGLPTQFKLGVDTLSMMMILLTVVLHPLAITASFRSIQVRTREHYAWMNVLLASMLGVWLARDLLLFYVFFETTLIPLFFIIGIFGGVHRRAAAGRYFLYTFFGSIFLLLGLVYLGVRAGSFDMDRAIAFAQTGLSGTERMLLLYALIAGFAVKIPLWPLHTWLPLAHTEAPTAGSVDLAALVLKLGTYGLLRITLPAGAVNINGTIANPEVLQALAVLACFGVLYAGLVAWAQRDVKKLIAYSSVSHLGFCVLGMLAMNDEGLQGSVYYMLTHGVSTGALFLLVGMIYNRYHTRDMEEMSGLGKAMPIWSSFFIFFVMASVGLPGLNGFVSEFLTLLGTFQAAHLGWPFGVAAAIGIVLSALYLLKASAKLVFGPLAYPVLTEEREHHGTIHPKYVMGGDITGREIAVLSPLAVLAVVLGMYPTPVLEAMQPALRSIYPSATVSAEHQARQRQDRVNAINAQKPSALEAQTDPAPASVEHGEPQARGGAGDSSDRLGLAMPAAAVASGAVDTGAAHSVRAEPVGAASAGATSAGRSAATVDGRAGE